MTGFDRPWALCGGWAVDAWLGRVTREHGDVDLAVSHDAQGAVRTFLRDGWLLNAHDPSDDDGTHDWDGHELGLPAHIHARAEGFNLDIQLIEAAGADWVFQRPDGPQLAVSRAIERSPWGLPTLAPELLILYKADADIRPHDEADIRALLPTLDAGRRAWLDGALAALDADVRKGRP